MGAPGRQPGKRTAAGRLAANLIMALKFSLLGPGSIVLDFCLAHFEESRRERQRRVDAGDETARLKFNPLLNQLSKPKAAPVVSSTAAAVASAVRPLDSHCT